MRWAQAVVVEKQWKEGAGVEVVVEKEEVVVAPLEVVTAGMHYCFAVLNLWLLQPLSVLFAFFGNLY